MACFIRRTPRWRAPTSAAARLRLRAAGVGVRPRRDSAEGIGRLGQTAVHPFSAAAVKCRQSWRVGGPERSDPARPAPPVAPEGALPPVLRRQCAEHVQRLIAVSLQTSMQSESPVRVRTTVTGRSIFRKVPSPPRAGEGQLRLACESLSGTRRNVCYAASARLPSALCQARGPGRIEYPGRIANSHGRVPVAQAADKGACGVWIVRSCPGGSPGMHQ